MYLACMNTMPGIHAWWGRQGNKSGSKWYRREQHSHAQENNRKITSNSAFVSSPHEHKFKIFYKWPEVSDSEDQSYHGTLPAPHVFWTRQVLISWLLELASCSAQWTVQDHFQHACHTPHKTVISQDHTNHKLCECHCTHICFWF